MSGHPPWSTGAVTNRAETEATVRSLARLGRYVSAPRGFTLDRGLRLGVLRPSPSQAALILLD